MVKIPLEIVRLIHSAAKTSNYAVVLGETEGSKRHLPIMIGSFEAQAIVVALEQMVPNRPFTHDLFKNTLESFNIDIKEVVINNVLDGVYYATLVCVKEGEVLEIDSRTSDAIALAVRFECPIYTYEFILDAAGMALEDIDQVNTTQPPVLQATKPKEKSLSSFSLEDLDKLLNKVLAEENYEKAAVIRDEINKRSD